MNLDALPAYLQLVAGCVITGAIAVAIAWLIPTEIWHYLGLGDANHD